MGGTAIVRVALSVPPDERVTFCLSRDASTRKESVESSTMPVNPPWLASVIPETPVDPTDNVREPGLADIVKSGSTNGVTSSCEETVEGWSVAGPTGTKNIIEANRIAASFLRV